MESGDDEALSEAWDEVLARWDDPAAHKRFLALADLRGALAFAGTRYRAVRDADPSRRSEAEARIDQLLGLAMVRVQTLRAPTPSGHRRLEWVAFGVSVTLVAAALYQALRGR